MGWTDQQLNSLHQPNGGFTPAERVALRFCELMTLDPHGISDIFFLELRAHFSEGEIVELAAVVGIFNYFNRFNQALRMESTD